MVIEVSRALGLDQYVIAQKSPKIHLADALVEELQSVTSSGKQRLMLDRRSVPLLAKRRVVVVDDVVATGSSLAATFALARAAGADVVGAGVILTEGHDWKKTLVPMRVWSRGLGTSRNLRWPRARRRLCRRRYRSTPESLPITLSHRSAGDLASLRG